MPKVTFLPVNQIVDAKEGDTLLELALDHDVPLTHACGGFCACTTCHVQIREGHASLLPPEEEEAERIGGVSGMTQQSRLGCQTRVGKMDLVVEIVNVDL